MRYLSVCSGIEAATVAWHPLGWEPVAFSEVEPFPRAVLAHHYPDVPNIGDMTKIDGSKYREAVELVVGGTPCQDFSVAGKRAGMAGKRGALALTYLDLLEQLCPRWVVWENVPGVLSTNGGRDFGAFLGGLEKRGYGFAYRILNAQYFGVPQRRRRVFVVGYFGDWRPAAAVLFEPHSLCGHPAPRRKAKKDIAGAITAGTYTGGADDNRAQGGFYVPEIVSQAMSCKWAKGTSGPAGDEHHNLVAISKYGEIAGTLTSEGADASLCEDRGQTIIAFHGSQDPDVSGTVTHPLGQNQGQEVCIAIRTAQTSSNGWGVNTEGTAYTVDQSQGQAVAYPCVCFAQNQMGEIRTGSIAGTLNRNSNASGRNTPLVLKSMQVRRLTPRECERLQGFPDDYTLIPYRGKTAADSPRYKALGNTMAVPVMRWIGDRIEAVENNLPAEWRK